VSVDTEWRDAVMKAIIVRSRGIMIARRIMGVRVTIIYRARVISGAIRIRRHRLNGKKDFQVIIIRRSYRIRGSAARTQINRAAKTVVIIKIAIGVRMSGIGVIINSVAERSLITKILQYSAIKIRANLPPPYSILKPDTSSDSPSAKSKGARFVSASIVTNHAVNRGGMRIRRGME